MNRIIGNHTICGIHSYQQKHHRKSSNRQNDIFKICSTFIQKFDTQTSERKIEKKNKSSRLTYTRQTRQHSCLEKRSKFSGMTQLCNVVFTTGNARGRLTIRCHQVSNDKTVPCRSQLTRDANVRACSRKHSEAVGIRTSRFSTVLCYRVHTRCTERVKYARPQMCMHRYENPPTAQAWITAYTSIL